MNETTTDARMAPHDLDAEACVLALCMALDDGLDRAAALVAPQAFYSRSHTRIFEALLALGERGAPRDAEMLLGELRDRGTLAEVGGTSYVTQVLGHGFVTADVEAYAHRVASKARLRAMQSVLHRTLSESYQPIDGEDDWLDRVERLVHEVGLTRPSRAASQSLPDVVGSVFRKLAAANTRAFGSCTGEPTGFLALDEQTGGLHPGESTILAARPGMGKTAFAMNVATRVARHRGGVVFFSLEMPSEQVATRALCSQARVDVRKARKNSFDRYDWDKLALAANEMGDCGSLQLVEEPCGLLDVRSSVRKHALEMKRRGVKLALVVVDYVQLMLRREGRQSREEDVAENARGLKLLAKEADCAVLALSQLNRAVELRGDKRPCLSDLRESGALEEAADCVIGMYRDDYYHQASKAPGIVELGLLKHRHGPTGIVEVGFEAKSTTFFNLRDEAAQ